MYGAALNHARNPGSYGEIWWPVTSRLASCPKMQDAYDEFLVARERKKKCSGICIFPGTKACKCRKKYEDRMESLERKGDAAWKKCKVAKARGEIIEEEGYVDSWSDEPDPYVQGPMVDSGPIYAPPSQPIYDQSAGNLVAASPTAGGSNMMLYAGLGIAGLAAVLLLKKK